MLFNVLGRGRNNYFKMGGIHIRASRFTKDNLRPEAQEIILEPITGKGKPSQSARLVLPISEVADFVKHLLDEIGGT